MKKAIHKSGSFLMALVVLCSTMSITINAHYCGGTLVATSLFSDVESCGMEQAQATLPNGCAMTKPDCCKNEQSLVKGQDELKLNFDKLSLDSQVFVAVFLQSYQTLFQTTEAVTPAATIFPPPNILKKRYKLDESYLI